MKHYSVLIFLISVLTTYSAESSTMVPEDKKLDPAWVQSLTERGQPAIYRGDDLKHIGMPIGGLFAGHVYLGGDGQLWHWDVFNKYIYTVIAHYVEPMVPAPTFQQGFTLKVGDRVLPLNSKGFSDISFRGEYPIGLVTYRDAKLPVEVTLEAFSPFIPLNTLDSSMPATILNFKIQNVSTQNVTATLSGILENIIGKNQHWYITGELQNRLIQTEQYSVLECSAKENSGDWVKNARPERVFEDWKKQDYEGWTVEGTAFGKRPITKKEIPSEYGKVRNSIDHLVLSLMSAPGQSAKATEGGVGKLTSKPFTIDRNFIGFWIKGGESSGKLGLNLIVDGKVVGSAVGKDNRMMTFECFNVKQYLGKQGVIEIVDQVSGGRSYVAVGEIRFFDYNENLTLFAECADYGTMALGVLNGKADESSGDQNATLNDTLVGSIGKHVSLKPGETQEVKFAIAWYFPNLSHIPGVEKQGRSYAAQFTSAGDVVKHIAANQSRLMGDTRLWRDTWYDSSLPYWFLDRTFLNASVLATSTAYRFKDGRFWAWEGIGNCPGTCGHVWYYGQSTARLFPDIEREQRENVDFKTSQRPNGGIAFRGEGQKFAIDAQSGYILRALREHQMSTDSEFLKRIWPGVKKATQWLIVQDGNGDGLIEGAQHNTLDTDWFGASAWLSGLYQSALQAAASMADEMQDEEFAKTCRAITTIGKGKLVSELFNGEYFQNKIDPAHLDAINSGSGCLIDQVSGQTWARQVGLPRIFPEKETQSALKALWRYNFAPDAGSYLKSNQYGRCYATVGESGLLICTFPKDDWKFENAKGKGPGWAAGYFNECQNGYEHQAAGGMIWEGLVQEGLAVERAIHDRYSASKRNPYNEIECGDHYGRATASYGVFLAVCGYEYNGPKKHLGFAPKIHPEKFKAAFTSAEGWGSFSQNIVNGKTEASLILKHGKLALKSFSLGSKEPITKAVVTLNGKPVESSVSMDSDKAVVTFAKEVILSANDVLSIHLTR